MFSNKVQEAAQELADNIPGGGSMTIASGGKAVTIEGKE
jgi:hypothetical protein